MSLGNLFLDNSLSKEIFEKKNQELERELLYFTQQKNKLSISKKITREEIESFLIKFKDNVQKEHTKRAIIETFLKGIKIYPNHVEITLRPFPLATTSDGGDDESRTRVRNHNNHKLLQV